MLGQFQCMQAWLFKTNKYSFQCPYDIIRVQVIWKRLPEINLFSVRRKNISKKPVSYIKQTEIFKTNKSVVGQNLLNWSSCLRLKLIKLTFISKPDFLWNNTASPEITYYELTAYKFYFLLSKVLPTYSYTYINVALKIVHFNKMIMALQSLYLNIIIFSFITRTTRGMEVSHPFI